MFDEINNQLHEAQEGIARLRKIDSKLSDLKEQEVSIQNKADDLKKILGKEEYDVQKIEKTSLSSLFYSVLGTLPEHIEKEKAEALAARLKYDQALTDLKAIEDEITKLLAERSIYADYPKRYDRLYEQKRVELLAHSGETADQLLKLSKDMSDAKIQLKEIREAIDCGNNVTDSLNHAIGSLESAKGWGTWDMLGGGLISDLAKHSHIDNAQAETQNAQMLLCQFKSELADIKLQPDIRFETAGFAKFADFFFDGLIADWVMQTKINNSMGSVMVSKNQVSDVITKLKSMETHMNNILTETQTKVNEIIIQS